MASANFTRGGQVSGTVDGGAQTFAPAAIVIATAVIIRVEPLNLASGDNTLSIPVGATLLIFTPPTTNTTVSLRKKGAGGDTGVGMHKSRQQHWDLDGSGDDIIINASATLNGCAYQTV